MGRTTADPKAQDLAQRLIAYEARISPSSKETISAAFQISEKLRHSLSVLAGASGFRALLGRALALTTAQFPSLSKLQLKADGSLGGLGELQNGNDPEEGLMLIAHLIGLLVTFIGEDLTFRLLVEKWPHLSVPALDFEEGSEHAPTN